jgi:hypothetical protein
VAVAFSPSIAIVPENALPAGTFVVTAVHVTVFTVGAQVSFNVGVGGGGGGVETTTRLSPPTYPVQLGIAAAQVSNFTCIHVQPSVLTT